MPRGSTAETKAACELLLDRRELRDHRRRRGVREPRSRASAAGAGRGSAPCDRPWAARRPTGAAADRSPPPAPRPSCPASSAPASGSKREQPVEHAHARPRRRAPAAAPPDRRWRAGSRPRRRAAPIAARSSASGSPTLVLMSTTPAPPSRGRPRSRRWRRAPEPREARKDGGPGCAPPAPRSDRRAS